MNSTLALTLVVAAALLPRTATTMQHDPADPLTPEPGKILRINFPELPKTLLAVHTGNDIPTAVLVRIPTNYNTTDTFPLYVFLEGGLGGAGSEIGVPMRISGGGHDVITASFPLFKKTYDPDARWPYVVGFDDFDAVADAYKAILDRLRDIIPNIDPQRSILGGHSNGAKTVAVLLSGLDQNTLDSFQGFFFIDGGLNWTSNNRPNTLQDHHIFYLVGGGEDNPRWWRKHFINRVTYYNESAQHLGMTNWKFKTYDGIGHEFAEIYFDELQEWATTVGADPTTE